MGGGDGGFPPLFHYERVKTLIDIYIAKHNRLRSLASPPPHFRGHCHRIKISNRRATQRCNVSAFFYAKICSFLARRRSSQPVQRVYWPENVIDWLGKWRPTCVMRHVRGPSIWIFILSYFINCVLCHC